jgi:hypothetical protein
VPHVSIDSKPQFTCTVERVPREQELGFDYITRFLANGNLAVTIRLQDVEQVLCPSPNAGKVLVARLYTGSAPQLVVQTRVPPGLTRENTSRSETGGCSQVSSPRPSRSSRRVASAC